MDVDRLVRHVYAILVSGLDSEQRSKIDAVLDSVDQEASGERARRLRAAGFTPERAELLASTSGGTVEARMAARVAAARARRAEITGGE